MIFSLLIFSLGCSTSIADSSELPSWRTIRPSPVPNTENRCHTKWAGSTPSCWNQDDWYVYCQYVECKKETSQEYIRTK